MLLLVILSGVFGYTLVYAGVRGDNASIGGVPLWQQPWLPLVAGFLGTGGDLSGGIGKGDAGPATPDGQPPMQGTGVA